MTHPCSSLLLVDDDDMTRDLLARYLERHGFAVTGVARGEEALGRLDKEGQELVLLDILLEGMSGLDVLTAIRQRYSATDVPVIMATSRDRSSDVVDALQHGANDYVTKPFDFPVVLARVQTQLALKRSVDQIRQLEQGLLRKNDELEQANRRMKRDLEAAARFQATLLPGQGTSLPPARFAWEFRPCTELAGDLLNIVPLDPRRVALYVLDVVGHGAAAALLGIMINQVIAQIHQLPGQQATPSEVAAHLSRELGRAFQTYEFFTLLYGILELDTGGFRFITAGHPGPIYQPRQKLAQSLLFPALPIGVGDEHYEEHSLTLAPGDRLYLYSDGLPDALNADEDRFGEDRILAHVEQGRPAPLADSVRQLLGAAESWCGPKPPHDDISLLAVELA
jgi:sigma-B regulation protein RsbU (phosphoserine phosphatase)